MTTGVACPAPILQFFGNDGNPLVGGSILTQVGGVNAATYQDSGLATPLPNPIPLNSRGEVSTAAGVSAQLFLTPNTVYTFTVSDASGNQLWVATYVDGVQVSITQALIGQTLWPQTAAEIAAGVTPTNYGYPELYMFRYLTSAQITDVINVTNTLDCASAINAANSVAAQHAAGGTVYFPPGLYRCLSNISIPNKVSWKSDGYPQTNIGGTAWNCGAVIYKAHAADGVSLTSSNNSSVIRRIGIWSNNTTWATGNGFVIGPASGCILQECTVRTVGGDSFVIGDNTANSYTNCCDDCYSNNPGGRGFVVSGFYFQGRKLITDGGTIGIEFTSQGSHFAVHNTHFEGFTTSAIKFDGVAGGVMDGLIETVAYVDGLVHVDFTGATTDVRIYGFDLGSPNTGTTAIGIRFSATAMYNVVEGAYFNYFGTGVLDSGNYNTVRDSTFFTSQLCYNASGDLYTFEGNRCINTAGAYTIAHNAGTRGNWDKNFLDKPINPVVTGHAGNFSGIKCRDNIGYITRTAGTTALIASGTAFAHGLAGQPLLDAGSGVLVSCNTASIPQPNVITSSADITLDWTGGANAQWNWSAWLPCDP